MLRTDVLEEHLEEVDFLMEQRERMLESSEHTLEDLEMLEARLRAHLDALTEGEHEAWALLEPKLEDGACGEAFAVAWVALETGEDRWLEAVRRAFLAREGEVRTGIAHALRRVPTSRAVDLCQPWLEHQDGEIRAIAVGVLGARRVPLSTARLAALVRDPAAQVAAAALMAVSQLGAVQVLPEVEGALERREPDVCLAAARAGLLLNSARALPFCRRMAARGGPCARAYLELLGLAGHPEDAEVLVQALEDPETTRSALEALGWLGHVAAVRPLIRWVGHAELAWTAAEAVRRITGWEIVRVPGTDVPAAEQAGAAGAGDQLEADDAVEDLDPWSKDVVDDDDGGGDVAIPDAQALAAWWRREAARFDVRVRYRYGMPHGTAVLEELLRTGALRERAGVVYELRLAGDRARVLETGLLRVS